MLEFAFSLWRFAVFWLFVNIPGVDGWMAGLGWVWGMGMELVLLVFSPFQGKEGDALLPLLLLLLLTVDVDPTDRWMNRWWRLLLCRRSIR